MKTIINACEDAKLFGSWFKDRASWAPWLVFLRALFALPMTASERDLFRQATGRSRPARQVAGEAWLVCGRRAGKSFVLALVAVFLACFNDFRKHLAKGERGTVMIVASDRRQARVILRYIQGLLAVPMLAKLVSRSTAQGFDLYNSITIEVHTCSFRSVRGYTVVACLLDEIAFWRGEEFNRP